MKEKANPIVVVADYVVSHVTIRWIMPHLQYKPNAFYSHCLSLSQAQLQASFSTSAIEDSRWQLQTDYIYIYFIQSY